MHSSESLIALGIGVTLALSPAGVAHSQSLPASEAASSSTEDPSFRASDSLELEQSLEIPDVPEVNPMSGVAQPEMMVMSHRSMRLEGLSPEGLALSAEMVDSFELVSQAIAASDPDIASDSDALEEDPENSAATSSPALEEDTGNLEETESAIEEPEEISQDRGEPVTDETDSAPENQQETLETELAPVEESTSDELPAVEPVEPIPTDETQTDLPLEDPSIEIEDAPTDGADSIGSADPAPEYLNPHPNPLLTPTQPFEVELIGTQPITLEQAIWLARRNNRELQIAELELEQARAALREAEAENLPTVTAGANLTVQENQSQPDLTPAQEALGLQQPEQDAADLIAQGSLEVNYNLLTGGRRSAQIRASEAQVQLRELQVETIAEQLGLDVANAYYDIQETDARVRIARTSVEQAEQSLQDAQALERAGVGTRFDVLSAQVDLANFQQELSQALSNQQIARRQLAQILSLSESVSISAADPVEVADRWDLTLEESIVLAYHNRAELEQQLLQREIADEQRRIARSETEPQVSLFAAYNLQDTLNDDGDITDLYSFGARFQWTLFNGGASRARADQAEADIAIAEEQFADVRNQVRFQVEQAYLNLQANFANISTASLALQQAQEALRLARLRFQAGVGTQTDVLRQQTELARAELNLVEATLGYNRQLVSLQRSVSNYPDGYLYDLP